MERSSTPTQQARTTRDAHPLRDLFTGALTHVALVATLLAIGPAMLALVAPRTFDAILAITFGGESAALGGGMLALLSVAPVALVQLPWTPRAQETLVSQSTSWLETLLPHDVVSRPTRRARAYR